MISLTRKVQNQVILSFILFLAQSASPTHSQELYLCKLISLFSPTPIHFFVGCLCRVLSRKNLQDDDFPNSKHLCS